MAQCSLCGAFTLASDDHEWVCEPFCWKCGSYLKREGNRWGWDGQKAKARAEGFDEKSGVATKVALYDSRRLRNLGGGAGPCRRHTGHSRLRGLCHLAHHHRSHLMPNPLQPIDGGRLSGNEREDPVEVAAPADRHTPASIEYVHCCDRCGDEFRASTRTGLFTLHAQHLKTAHFPNWGSR